MFDEISTTIESVIDPRPVEVEEVVTAEIRAHLPPQPAEHVVAPSDGVEPQMRQFVRGFRNGVRSTTRNFWRNVGRGIGRSLKLLTGGIGVERLAKSVPESVPKSVTRA